MMTMMSARPAPAPAPAPVIVHHRRLAAIARSEGNNRKKKGLTVKAGGGGGGRGGLRDASTRDDRVHRRRRGTHLRLTRAGARRVMTAAALSADCDGEGGDTETHAAAEEEDSKVWELEELQEESDATLFGVGAVVGGDDEDTWVALKQNPTTDSHHSSSSAAAAAATTESEHHDSTSTRSTTTTSAPSSRPRPRPRSVPERLRLEELRAVASEKGFREEHHNEISRVVEFTKELPGDVHCAVRTGLSILFAPARLLHDEAATPRFHRQCPVKETGTR